MRPMSIFVIIWHTHNHGFDAHVFDSIKLFVRPQGYSNCEKTNYSTCGKLLFVFVKSSHAFSKNVFQDTQFNIFLS